MGIRISGLAHKVMGVVVPQIYWSVPGFNGWIWKEDFNTNDLV